MIKLNLMEKGILYSIFGGLENLEKDLAMARRGDENFIEYPINWDEYKDYTDILESLEKKNCLIVRCWDLEGYYPRKHDYFHIGECEYNAILEGFKYSEAV